MIPSALRTTSESSVLPEIDSPLIKKLLLPDERSLSDMELPPIERVGLTIHAPLLLYAVEGRFRSSENVMKERDAISIISQAPSRTTHTRGVDVQHGVGGTNVTGYRLSTGSSMSAINLLSPRGDHHRDGGMNKVDSQLRRSSQLLSAVRVPNVHADLAAKPPSQKQRNGADLPKVPAFRRIRQLLLPSGNRTPLAIWIMPAQCTEW
ncbi:hypothetical protein EDC04DRAFT_77747 [Pisolithus marmoratus]|nr:hypothetical protein EDC04DRAFT_77747 [Pisolithus marmoratus]